MTLINYEYDTEFRWFTFFCEVCEHGTTLGEPIDEEYYPNYEDGTKHEPLTFEELQKIEKSKNMNQIAERINEDGKTYVDFSKEFKEENR